MKIDYTIGNHIKLMQKALKSVMFTRLQNNILGELHV